MSALTAQDRNAEGTPTRIRYCRRHKGLTGQSRLDHIRAFGMGGWTGGYQCQGAPCRMFPGTDYISAGWIARLPRDTKNRPYFDMPIHKED